MSILADLTSKSQAELIAIIEAQAAARTQRITMKVTEKGALSVYGLGRFPVTLYASQWRRLLTEAGAISAFLKANAATLTEKA